MPGSTSTGADFHQTDGDAWPWQCLDCGATIYHDGEFCRDCTSIHQIGDVRRRAGGSRGFTDWVRGESCAIFVAKVSVVAGVEVSLTTFWLRLLSSGSVDLGTVVSLIG